MFMWVTKHTIVGVPGESTPVWTWIAVKGITQKVTLNELWIVLIIHIIEGSIWQWLMKNHTLSNF